jgi:putative ABC transport system permease protein
VSRIFTNLWGAILEAWTELRIHKLRVLLSLIGVAVAVTALTTVVALGQIAEQAGKEQNERQGGRPALIYVGAYTNDGSPMDVDAMDKAFNDTVDRYSITYASHNGYMNARVQLPGAGVVDVQGQAIDADFGTMHRVTMLEGSWFTDADNDRLAPAVIINEYFWKQLGSPDLATHPTTVLLGENDVEAVIIGVTPSSVWEEWPMMFMLYSAYERITDPVMQASQPPAFELWVPPVMAADLIDLVKRDMSGALGDNYQVDAQRQDYEAFIGQGEDPLATLKLMVAGGALLVLLLGALGLVNISLVTVRQRIREIGIRRSFGATAGRVFFAVMMESIVATFVAGVVGVIVAVLVVQSPLVQEQVGQGVVDLPPFPAQAALLGIVASVIVGAIAGLLPALVAVRVRVIDAIRY